MNQRYFLATTIVGGVPWMVPLFDDDLETLYEIYQRLDGILLPGGVDMDPATFGEPRHQKLGAVDPARDRVELQLARWAIEERKPVLGLCRGIQVINVPLGGTLYQDIADQVPAAIKHDYFPTAGFERDHLAHDVTVAAGTRLHAVMRSGARSGSTACITRPSRPWPLHWCHRPPRPTGRSRRWRAGRITSW